MKELFSEIYNKTLSEYQSDNEKFLKAVKKVTNKCTYDKDILKLSNEEESIRLKLSTLLEMKLELDKSNTIDREIYNSKEIELKERLDKIYNKKKNLELLQDKHKSLSDRINKIEKTLNENRKLK